MIQYKYFDEDSNVENKIQEMMAIMINQKKIKEVKQTTKFTSFLRKYSWNLDETETDAQQIQSTTINNYIDPPAPSPPKAQQLAYEAQQQQFIPQFAPTPQSPQAAQSSLISYNNPIQIQPPQPQYSNPVVQQQLSSNQIAQQLMASVPSQQAQTLQIRTSDTLQQAIPQPFIPQAQQIPQAATNTSPLIARMLTLYEKLKVRDAIHNQSVRDIYKSLMLNKRMERQQANTAYLISQMFHDTFFQFLELMKRYPQHKDQLACLFVEEHLDFLVTARKGITRKQVQNDKLICGFAILLKLMKAQGFEGRLIFCTMMVTLTHKLNFLFVRDQNSNPDDLTKDSLYFETIFYTSQSNTNEQLSAPASDPNLKYLSIIRKLSMLLWAILWLDPNIFITDEMNRHLRGNLIMYSKCDLIQDRSIFYEYAKTFVACARRKPSFHHVPTLSSLWDVLSHALYNSQQHKLSDQNNEEIRLLLKTIFDKCQDVINLPRNETILLNDIDQIHATTHCLAQMKIEFPQLSNQFIKSIHNELFVAQFFNQKGQIEILKTKQAITDRRINSNNEDCNDYDFFKTLFEADLRQEYYT